MRGDRGQGLWDGPIEGTQDSFSLLGRVELEVVELFGCFAVAMEGFGSV